ncbi:MAG: hypothetical protein EP334_02535 [Gammaproteobacteria bacterium]|nr:MAG: hypothetical protein EP334_02535 [Gammaproteobacteria bacterium]
MFEGLGLKEYQLSWEIVIGISSSVIALCALIYSIGQGKQLQKHNRLSFRPHLTTWTHNEHRQGRYAVDLLNNGLGPALIKTFTIKVDGKKISGNGTEPIDKALKIIFPNDKYDAHYSYMGENYSMGAKDKCRVVIVQFFGEQLPSSDYVEHNLNRAELEVEYESFYGDKFFFSTAEEKPNK